MTKEIKKKYVIDENGKRAAVQLDIKTFDKLLDEIDDLYCALGYEEAKIENAEDIKNGNFKTIHEVIHKKRNMVKKNPKRKTVK